MSNSLLPPDAIILSCLNALHATACMLNFKGHAMVNYLCHGNVQEMPIAGKLSFGEYVENASRQSGCSYVYVGNLYTDVT